MARIILGLLIILLIAPFTPQIPGCITTHRSKSGKVVDVETGKGLPNALVISSARFVSDPVFFGPSGNMVLYNVIVRTDAEGRFSIPSTWSDLYIATPGTHPRITWVVTVFEPGYAVVGDESLAIHGRLWNAELPAAINRTDTGIVDCRPVAGKSQNHSNVQADSHVEAGGLLLPLR
ncbi:MAG: hypothetical protein IPP82_14390 [Xanthomonadales bacterium]|nr:hypothetical protein [Xanthomonadales bacterium]